MKSFVPTLCVMSLLLSNNINIHSSWVLSLETFRSVCPAAAADDRQIRCSPSIPEAASKDFSNDFYNTSQYFIQVHVIFRFGKKLFIYFIVCIYLKQMRLDSPTNLWWHFSVDVRSPTFDRVFSQFLLEFALRIRPLVYILWVNYPYH